MTTIKEKLDNLAKESARAAIDLDADIGPTFSPKWEDAELKYVERYIFPEEYRHSMSLTDKQWEYYKEQWEKHYRTLNQKP